MNINRSNANVNAKAREEKFELTDLTTRLTPEEIQAFFAVAQKAAQEAIKRAYLSTRDAGAYLSVSPRWLEELRVIGGGPLFLKLGRRVVYRMENLDEWAAGHERRNTAE
jgi:hypothetical protein